MRSELRARVFLAALGLAGILGAAQAARAATLTFSTPISGDAVLVTLELIDAPGGDAVDVAVSIPEGAGDVSGVFGNLVTPSLVAGMGVDDPSGIVNQYQFELDRVDKVGAANTLSPVKGWDWGVKLGATGSPGGAVVERASFRLTGPGLTVAELLGAVNQGFVFGVRVQSTSGAEGSSKLGLSADAPRLHIDAPPEGALLAAPPASVTGGVLGSGVAVDVNGTPATVAGERFEASLDLADGAHTIVATATLDSGTAHDSVNVRVDTMAPVVTITEPAAGLLTGQSSIAVAGTVTDQSAVAEVDVNGAPVPLVGNAFASRVALVEGLNSLTATARDEAGHVGSTAVDVTLDTTPPVVAITTPLSGVSTSLAAINVSGTASDEGGVSEVVVNGAVATLSGTTWSVQVPLSAGVNTIVATGTDAVGNTANTTITVNQGSPPSVVITSPTGGTLTKAPQLTVTGDAPGATTVSVNGFVATLSSDGAFSATPPLAEGTNTLTATATNAFGEAQASIVVTRDSTAPVVTIDLPPDGAVVSEPEVGVFGTVVDANPIIALTLNGSAIVGETAFAETLVLSEGVNTILVVATDAAGNTGQAAVDVTLAEPAPLAISITQPVDGTATDRTEIAVAGSVTAGADSVMVNGSTAALTGTTWSARVPLAEGSNRIQALASRGGETATAAITVVRVASLPPPPPEEPVASAVDPTVATDLGSATAFLHTGPDAIQTGVAPDAIDPRRAAVVRGRLLTRAGAPLASVRVVADRRPELGETLTRSDGRFDLAVNGGGLVTVRFERDGYVPVYRTLEVPWRDIAVLDDLVLVPRAAEVAVIDPAAADAFQVARGAAQSDTLGTRRPTILVPQGTQAAAILPDGSTQPLGRFFLRITELTVGPTALAAVPASMPPGVDPTFVFDFSLDEAEALGARGVRFSQPVLLYLENAGGMPVGASAPYARFDEISRAWVPGLPGVVLEIVGESDGQALVDTDGDGQSDDAARLAALGITGPELAQLAVLYEPGQELRRQPTDHFSYGCPHIPPIFPPGAETPQQPAPRPGVGADECDCLEGGSLLRLERQVWSERVDLVGTPFDLHYESDRTLGHRASNSLRIPLTGPVVPGPLEGVALEVQVAGRRFAFDFPPAPDQVHRFVWDGIDAYGRRLQGRQPVQATIRYLYTGIANGRLATLAKSQTWRGEIGPWDARAAGLGGWTLSVHHAYDPGARVLHRGDGRRRSAGDLPSVVSTVFSPNGRPFAAEAGPDGSVYAAREAAFGTGLHEIVRWDPDGTTQSLGILSGARDIAVAPNGRVCVASNLEEKIWCIEEDGSIETVAGTGSLGFRGDGGPATQAEITRSFSIAFGPDGALYFADELNFRIRRIRPDGIIETVAGNGSIHFENVEGPALEAGIGRPFGVAFDGDGNLYMAVANNSTAEGDHILRMDPQGALSIFAGDPSRPASAGLGDGEPAIQARIEGARDLAFGPDGSLYLRHGRRRIRRITPDGIIQSVLGGAAGTGFNGDGRPGPDTAIGGSVESVSVGPDGAIFFGDRDNGRVRRLAAPLPGFAVGDFVVASEDGSELYLFDATGRHTETRDVLTGATLFTFAYTEKGLLDTVTDADGNVTRIERDSAGGPTGIVDPFGQRTGLSVDASGSVDAITDPAGATIAITSTAEGQVTALARPGVPPVELTYDGLGRVVRDEDPAGGFLQLERAADATGRTVTITTALGRQRAVSVDRLPAGGRLETRVGFDGLAREIAHGADGLETTTTPDGMAVARQEGPDPRFGLAAPVAMRLEIATPGGLLFARSQARTASVDPDTGALESQTDTITVNGRTSTVAYDGASRTVTTTTAAGRLLEDTLDPRGRLVATQVDGLEAVRLGYDPAGRLESLAQGTGAAERLASLAYDAEGNLASVTDPRLRTVAFAYDAAGRVIRQTLPDGRAIAFRYDGRGNLTSLTPPGQPAHVFRYTVRDQEAEYEPPPVVASDPRTFFTYDLDKNLVRVDRPDGRAVALGYDAAGRLETVAIPRGTITQRYDPATGKVASITAPGGQGLAFAYDGDLVTDTTWTGPVNGTVSQTYDADFRVASQSVNGDHTAGFTYDADGLLTQAGALALARDPLHGLLTGTSLGVVTTSQASNGFGERAADAAAVGGATLYGNTYTRDKLGRILRKVETIQGVTTTFDYGYDLAGRLATVHENGVLAATYAYDANGNRLGRTSPEGTETGTYDAQDRLVRYAGATYTQNAAGDRTSRTDPATGTTTTYAYDALGNLTQVGLPDGRTVGYGIDGQNRRVGRTMNGTPTQGFLYQDPLNPVAELDGAGNVVARFVYGSRPNVPDSMVKGGTTYRILSDHLGSVRLVVDASTGAVAQRIDYDEFGNITSDTNPGFQPFGFAGGIYDADTGLVRFGARDYDPEVGRWTVKDPDRFDSLGTNFYSYSFSDPLNFRDPTGQIPLFTPLGPAGATLLEAVTEGAGTLICVASRGLVNASLGLGPLGDLSLGVLLTGAGATVFGGSVLPLGVAATAGAGATGVSAAAFATAMIAAAGAYATAFGTTVLIDAANATFSTNLASFSSTPSAFEGAFPNLFPNGNSTLFPGVACGCRGGE